MCSEGAAACHAVWIGDSVCRRFAKENKTKIDTVDTVAEKAHP